MMNPKIDLALSYLQLHPETAAAVLEQQAINDVALFFNDLPYKQAAVVLKKMLPQYTARLLKLLDPTIAAGYMSEMEIGLIAAIMRHSDAGTNQVLLGHLPETTQLACTLLLSYPDTSVGAWMNTRICILPNDCTVEEALTRIAEDRDFNAMAIAYVADRERKLQGMVNITNLLSASPNMPITSVMLKNPDALSGLTSLISAINNPLWNSVECLAVINKNKKIIGILRHLDLRVALGSIKTTIQKPKGTDPITDLCAVYGNSLLEIFNTISDTESSKTAAGSTLNGR